MSIDQVSASRCGSRLTHAKAKLFSAACVFISEAGCGRFLSFSFAVNSSGGFGGGMHRHVWGGIPRAAALLAVFALAASSLLAGPASELKVPVEYYKLPNGLRVVLSQDHTAPTVCVAVYYRIGFRVEPKDRTGFAHLFEHMMFQGSANLGKMEFIKLVQQNGGILNGSTRFDFTNYFEILPSNKL